MAGSIQNEPLLPGAVLKTVGRLGFITVLDKSFDICELAATGVPPSSCPLALGPQKIQINTFVSSDVTTGVRFSLTVSAKNPNGKQLFCFQGPLSISNLVDGEDTTNRN